MDSERADSFLRLIRKSQRGRLKIYLGYAAGVGKTYQMLLEAHRLRRDGIDVAVGFVETHGRAETEALLEGLEVIPRHKSVYRGIGVEELDLKGVLARKPGVVLVDELAHTNAPGSKNDKRYQDVEEILAAGIHVISALNIQHLESLYEIVERTTAVKVRERIPDHVVAEADQLVNVDITSEDLRRRLQEGRIYATDRVEAALGGFFTPSKLEQLRELALRELAAQIDSKRRDAVRADDASASPDQVMVCLSSRGPNSEALLRYASRLAGRLNRNWYAVYVQTERESPLAIDAATQRLLANALTLAQQLGATVFTYRGDDVVKTILQFAKEYRVGHIVVGAPGRRLPLWRRVIGESGIVERLMLEARDITVVVHDTRKDDGGRPWGAARAAPAAASAQDGLQVRAPERAGCMSQGGVVIWRSPVDKNEALRQLLNACKLGSGELERAAWDALVAREKQGETFVGRNVAIPHARLPGLLAPAVALGVATRGVEGDLRGRELRLMFLLVTPTEPAQVHVRALSKVSALARDERWLAKAAAAQQPSELADDLAALQPL